MRKFKHHGNNRKPDCQQFEAALRKVLEDKHITHSDYGNCTVIDGASNYCPTSNIGTVSSKRPKKSIVETKYTKKDTQSVLNVLNTNNNERSQMSVIDLSDTSISYIASEIGLQFLKIKNVCSLCKNVFVENEKVHAAFTSEQHWNIACESTFEICRTADYFMKLDVLKGQFDLNLICHSIISSLHIDRLYENTNFETHGHEKLNLVIQILQRYINYKARMIGKSVTNISMYQKK